MVRRKNRIDHLMCSHFGGTIFFEALFELVDPRSVIFSPSTGPWAAVTDVVTLMHLPPGAFDKEGEPPTVVADAKALEGLIFGSD